MGNEYTQGTGYQSNNIKAQYKSCDFNLLSF